jgi:hypothetical protein
MEISTFLPRLFTAQWMSLISRSDSNYPAPLHPYPEVQRSPLEELLHPKTIRTAQWTFLGQTFPYSVR